MAYRVPHSDKESNGSIIVPDKEINVDTSLALIGKNVFDYGQPIATNFLHLLENFACSEDTESPGNPDTAKCESLARPVQGQLWYNSTTDSYHYYDGSQWNGIGFGTGGPLTITDDTSKKQTVTAFYDEGELIAVVSGETFTIHPTQEPRFFEFNAITNGAGIIKKGITLKNDMMFHGTATSAQYADLAEMYMGDKSYDKGTVMKIGGTEEVTQTTSPYCDKVFGIVSSDPAYLMNSALSGTPIALEGRVPCKVVGKVQKGDRLVASDIPGVAMVADTNKVTWMNQVGRALEDKETEEIGLIEVVVGVK